MNIDFSNEPLFSWYVVLLAFSGVVLLGLAAAKGGLSTGMRVFNAIVGVAFLGYGFYLGFVFEGGTYIIFFKAFFVPILLVANFVKSLGARRKANAPRQFQPNQPYPPQQPNQPYAPAPAQASAPAPQPYQDAVPSGSFGPPQG